MALSTTIHYAPVAIHCPHRLTGSDRLQRATTGFQRLPSTSSWALQGLSSIPSITYHVLVHTKYVLSRGSASAKPVHAQKLRSPSCCHLLPPQLPWQPTRSPFPSYIPSIPSLLQDPHIRRARISVFAPAHPTTTCQHIFASQTSAPSAVLPNPPTIARYGLSVVRIRILCAVSVSWPNCSCSCSCSSLLLHHASLTARGRGPRHVWRACCPCDYAHRPFGEALA